jgi:hypothetical protein
MGALPAVAHGRVNVCKNRRSRRSSSTGSMWRATLPSARGGNISQTGPRESNEQATSPATGGGRSSSLELAIRQGADGRWSSRPAGCAQPGDQRAGSFDGVDLAQSWGNLGRVVPARQTLANERRYCTQRSAGTKHRGSLHHLPRHVGAAPEVFGVRLLSPGYSFPSPGAKRPKLVQSALRAPPRRLCAVRARRRI